MKKIRSKTRKMPQINKHKLIKNNLNKNKEKWNWVQSVRQTSQQVKDKNQVYNSNLKLKNKTKVNQIKYDVEDLEEKNRRILQVMQYVNFCNDQLKNKLDKENISLSKMQQRLSIKHKKNETSTLQSLNLLKSLEREYCDLMNQVKNNQIELDEVKNSNLYFDYQEQKIFQEILQQEIQNKNQKLKAYKHNHCGKSKIQQVQRQIQNLKLEIKDIGNDININKKEIKIVKQKQRLIDIQKVKHVDESDKKLSEVLQSIEEKIVKATSQLDRLNKDESSNFLKDENNYQTLLYLHYYIILNDLNFDYVYEIQQQLQDQQNKQQFLCSCLQSNKYENFQEFISLDQNLIQKIYNKFLQDLKKKLINSNCQQIEQGCYQLDDFISKFYSNDTSLQQLNELLTNKQLKSDDSTLKLDYNQQTNKITLSKVKKMQDQKQSKKNNKIKTNKKSKQNTSYDSFEDI